VAWLGSSQVIRQGISILTTVVLARFLGPAEFGIFAMTLFVNELAQLLVDFGMGSALVQRKEISQKLLSSCFWINLAVGVVAALVLVLAGPWIAAYFEQPMVRWLLLASGVSLIIAALSVLPQALLARELAFRDVALATLLGSLAGAAAAIAAAVAGLGVWSLAMQPALGSLTTTLLLFARTRWLPGLEFSWVEVKEVMAFSIQLLGSSVLGHVTRNLTSLILGPAMGAAALGLLTMAQTIAWLPVAQVSQAVVRATLPVFSQLQGDLHRFREGFYKATSIIALLTFPLIAGIAVLAPDLVPTVFGAKWANASPLVQALCGLSLVQCVATLSGTALLALGRAGTLMRLSLIGLPLTAATLWVARDSTLLQAVLWLVAASIVMYALSMTLALKAIGGRWRDLLRSVCVPLLNCLISASLLWALRSVCAELDAVVRLFVMAAVGGLTYAGLCWWLSKEAVRTLISLIRGKGGVVS